MGIQHTHQCNESMPSFKNKLLGDKPAGRISNGSFQIYLSLEAETYFQSFRLWYCGNDLNFRECLAESRAMGKYNRHFLRSNHVRNDRRYTCTKTGCIACIPSHLCRAVVLETGLCPRLANRSLQEVSCSLPFL